MDFDQNIWRSIMPKHGPKRRKDVHFDVAAKQQKETLAQRQRRQAIEEQRTFEQLEEHKLTEARAADRVKRQQAELEKGQQARVANERLREDAMRVEATSRLGKEQAKWVGSQSADLTANLDRKNAEAKEQHGVLGSFKKAGRIGQKFNKNGVDVTGTPDAKRPDLKFAGHKDEVKGKFSKKPAHTPKPQSGLFRSAKPLNDDVRTFRKIADQQFSEEKEKAFNISGMFTKVVNDVRTTEQMNAEKQETMALN